MKRVILLGVSILFACSMTMAADLNIDGSGTIAAGAYDNINLNVGAGAVSGTVDVAASATVTASGNLSVTDTDVAGVSTTLNIGAGTSVSVGGYIVLGGGGHAEVNVAGDLDVTGHLTYDGNNTNAGVDVDLNISGDANVQGGLHMIFGGYSAAYTYDVTISDNANVQAGGKPIYIAGTQGFGTCTMSGNAVLQNSTYTSTPQDNMISVGWDNPGQTGVLTVEAGNTVEAKYIRVRAAGTVNFILDAAGQACVLTAADVIDPGTGELSGTDSTMLFYDGCILDLDYSGVAAGLLVPGYAMDIATTPEWYMLQWELGDGGTDKIATLAPDDMYGPVAWRLREKPGESRTLQAYVNPEPTTMALLGLGGILLAIRRRS